VVENRDDQGRMTRGMWHIPRPDDTRNEAYERVRTEFIVERRRITIVSIWSR